MKKCILAVAILLCTLISNSQVFTENFYRANNTLVGNGWTDVETVFPGSAQIVSKKLQLGYTTAERELVCRDVSSLYILNGITNNTGLIEWAFSFRQPRTTQVSLNE